MTPTTPLNRTPVVRALDAEWSRLCRRRCPERLAAWPDLVADPLRHTSLELVLAATTDLSAVLDATHRPDHRTSAVGDVDPDLLLGALIDVSRRDELAATIVVRRITPAVIAASRRWLADRDERSIDQAIGACWIAVADFDPDRRPRNIAAALTADVVWGAFRRPLRRMAASEVPVGSESLVHRPADAAVVHPLVTLAETIDNARTAGVDDAHLDLVVDLVRHGSTAAVADRSSVTARTIRNRRAAACEQIRHAVTAA